MRAMSRVVPALFSSLWIFHPAASAIPLTDLPATVQTCITAGDCSVGTPSYDSGRAQAFALHDLHAYKPNGSCATRSFRRRASATARAR